MSAGFLTNACLNCDPLAIRYSKSPRTSPLLDISGVPASASEENITRGVIEEAETELAALDRHLARLRDTLAFVTTERQDVQLHLNIHKAFISPIRRIPPEMLGEIFAQVEMGDDSLDVRGGPWLIACVCKQWREVALSTASLWVFIHLRLLDHLCAEGLTTTPSTRRLSLILDRSGSGLLTVEVDAVTCSDENNRVAIFESIFNSNLNGHPFLCLLVRQRHRWKEAHFYDDTGSSIRAALAEMTAPTFENLSTLSYTRVEDHGVSFDLGVFHNSPLLTDLCLDFGDGYIQLSTALRLPWAQLKKVRLILGHSDMIIYILNSLENVEELLLSEMYSRLNVVDDSESNSLTPSRKRYPRLRRLELAGILTSYLLNRIDAPALEELSLDRIRDHDVACLTAFIQRSSCSIHTLQLHSISLTLAYEFLPIMLQSMPTLRALDARLKSYVNGNEDYLLTTLSTLQENGTFLCPKLERMSLWTPFQSKCPFSPAALVDMLELRWNPGDKACRLKYFNAAFSLPWSAEEIGRLRHLHHEGMVFYIKGLHLGRLPA